MTKPRVLMLGPLPPAVGGIATVMESLVQEMSSMCEVRVINNAKTTPADRNFIQAALAQLRLLVQLACSCITWRPTVVHIHTCSRFTFWRNGLDALVARLLGRPVVIHIHGAVFEPFLASLSKGRARLARSIFFLCNRVVVLGDGWKKLLDGWCEPARVVVVPNGVPVPELREPAEDGRFTVVCLANYEARKGQEDLIEAVAALGPAQPVRLALLGDDTEAGRRQHLAERARALGIADRVELPGPVSGAAKDAWWAVADAFCLPSYYEGLPMSMLEAMARGLPVVVTRVGSIPEVVTDGVDGLLYAPGDVAALTAHLRALVTQPVRARALGLAAREKVRQEFSLARSAARLMAVYDGLGRR